jgi:hypothetical protein
VSLAGATNEYVRRGTGRSREALLGLKFTVPFLAILLVHEFGHYIAARIHRVDASLPCSRSALGPFRNDGRGDLHAGADPLSRRTPRHRASGPLAGLVVAIQYSSTGFRSLWLPISHDHYLQEGQSALPVEARHPGPIQMGWTSTHRVRRLGRALITRSTCSPGAAGRRPRRVPLLGSGTTRWRSGSGERCWALRVHRNRVHPAGSARHSRMTLMVAFTNSFFWLMWYLVLA